MMYLFNIWIGAFHLINQVNGMDSRNVEFLQLFPKNSIPLIHCGLMMPYGDI